MSSGSLVRIRLSVQIGGHSLVFRPFSVAESEALVDDVEACKGPTLLIELAACRLACESGAIKFDAMVDEFPLACSGTILPKLLKTTAEEANARIKTGVRRYKAADRSPGRMAEHLLAFKAYQGGDIGAKEFAGALAVAELINTAGGILITMQNYLKAMSKR